MDSFQHVNNIVYFRYFESVRMAYFERIGVRELIEQTGVGPILAETHCQYKFPLKYPDTISVGARVTAIESDRFHMEYCIVSQTHQRVAASGEAWMVSYNYREQKKAILPEVLRARMQALECRT